MISPTTTPSFDRTPRIWLAEDSPSPGPQTVLFRRLFDVPDASKEAILFLYAELRYQLWVNGQYVGRGPILHHPTVLPFDRHDITALLRPGRNVIAVLVHTPGMSLHNSVPLGEPGLMAQLHLNGNLFLQTDARWILCPQSGWSSSTPKRCWALGPIEQVDMAAVPAGWNRVDFDDHHWVFAGERPSRPSARVLSPLPPLRYEDRLPIAAPELFEITDAPTPITATSSSAALADQIMRAAWKKPEHVRIAGRLQNGTLAIEGLSPDHGAILCLDLGKEYVGQVTFECDCPGAGTIDVGWSEMAMDGRPQLSRKGVSYVDRVLATAGHLDWQPIGFNSARYIVLTFRGFSGPIRIGQIAYRSSETDLPWAGEFQCSDERLNGVWELCRHTLRVSTQEGLMDCPSREQSTYIGDGHPVAKWTAQLTGDARHWKYLVIEQFRRQAPDGMIRSTPFSGRADTLIDYPLLGIMGTRDYYQFTGDLQTVREVIDGCRRVLGWYDARRDPQGFFLSNWAPPKNAGGWEYPYIASEPRFDRDGALNLFIDHPGMGWHNVGEAGIDRRGVNAAINALLVMARRALADLEEALGNKPRAAELRAQADDFAAQIGQLFTHPATRAFHDGRLNGELLPQVSEQTNTWAIAAGCCDASAARTILSSLLTKPDPTVARNGPYFWTYLFPLLADLNLPEIACRKIREDWGRMLDKGASTLWETFKGDHLDSWCHPWSAAPVEFFFGGILGLPAACLPGQRVTLRPRFDVLPAASGKIITAAGPIAIGWTTDSAGAVRLQGSLPAGMSANLITPDGQRLQVSGTAWSVAPTDSFVTSTR